MKVAVVTPYLPYPPDTGGKSRSFHLLRGLSRQHTVDLFTVSYDPQSTDAAAVQALRDFCVTAHVIKLQKNPDTRARLVRAFDPLPRVVDHFHTPFSLAEVRQRLQEEKYDLLVVDEICMTPYGQGFPGPKLVIRHKVDHVHYREVAATQPLGIRKLMQWVDAYKLRRYEQRAMTQFHTAVCCSEDDAAIIRALNPEVPLTVIGNGVDLSYFAPLEELLGLPTLLYMGTMHYYPNIDAVHYFFRTIHPQLVQLVPDAQVWIVGHNPPADILAWQRLPGVTVSGSVPDVRPYLKKSLATIVPLRLGSGTRLKILESIAAQRPVVSTSVGAEGLGLRHDEHLLIADDPGEFAKQTAELLRNPALRQRLIAAARPIVATRYSWQALGEQYEGVCREVAGRGTV